MLLRKALHLFAVARISVDRPINLKQRHTFMINNCTSMSQLENCSYLGASASDSLLSPRHSVRAASTAPTVWGGSYKIFPCIVTLRKHQEPASKVRAELYYDCIIPSSCFTNQEARQPGNYTLSSLHVPTCPGATCHASLTRRHRTHANFVIFVTDVK